MLEILWQNDSWRALAGGLGFLLLRIVAGQVGWRLAGQPGAPMRRAGWAVVGEVLGLLVWVGYPFLLAIAGVYSPRDVGLLPIAWRAQARTLAVVAAGGALWLGLLWRPSRGGAGAREGGESGLTVPAAVRQEAQLAACRAALAPLAGPYWGVWLGLALATLASATDPRLQARLARPAERRHVYLAWSLDWISAATFAFYGSLWPGLALRVVLSVTMGVLTRLARAPRPSPTTEG